MPSWDDFRYFLAIHRAGTLARAASELRINATTAGRRLTALEEELNTKLFDRTPDGYALTTAGRDLLPRAERMEQEALAVEREVIGADARLSGLVRVSATEMLVTRFITPHLPRLHEQHPDIQLELSCTNRVVSLARREADIALRLARPREDNVVTKELAEIPLALYASPHYLEKRGVPADPDHGIAGHDALMFAATRDFRYENDWFEPLVTDANVVMRSDSVSSIYAATIAGLGIGLLPRAIAEHSARLVRIVTSTSPKPRVIWQTVHRDLRGTARVRAVMEFFESVLVPPSLDGEG